MNMQVYDNHIRIFCEGGDSCTERCDDLVSYFHLVHNFKESSLLVDIGQLHWIEVPKYSSYKSLPNYSKS